MPKKKKTTTKVRKTSRKSAKKTQAKSKKPIGTVTHFFTGIKVAIIKFKKPFTVGGKIRIQGATTDFEAHVESMQYDHAPIKRAPKNKEVGIKVKKRVRPGDEVFEVR
jgi:hypothetical protein